MDIITETEKIWKPSLNFLINNFRDSLIALIPTMETSRIAWKDKEQSESFDGITENLFQWFVVNNLENMIRDKYQKELSIAKYNYFYKDYSKFSFIDVVHQTEDPLAFQVLVSLGTKEKPFDTVFCDRIDQMGKIIKRSLEYNIDEVSFRFQFRKVGGELKTFDKIQMI